MQLVSSAKFALPLGLLALPLAIAVTRRAHVVEVPILTIYGASLETLQVTAKTTIQDIRPQLLQRGANLDGRGRKPSLQGMAIQGNPFEDVWSSANVSGVDLANGTFTISDVDIALPAEGFPWVIGRTYNAHQEYSSSHSDSDGPQGKNWMQTSQPEILLYDDATTAADDLVYVFYGADRFAEYKRADASSSTFRSRNGSAGVIAFTAAAGDEPETYKLVDQNGREFVFFGFDANADPADGQIWTITDADGNKAYVGDDTTASTAITNGYTNSGRISKAYDSSDRRYTYTYDGATDRLTQVKAETKTGGTWASPTGVTEVAKVDYEYYGDETYGDTGDLKLVKITTPLTDSGVELVKKKYYRYWEGTFNASTNPGHPHGLKYIVDFEGTRNQDYDDSTFDEDFKTLSNDDLKVYASAYFEYDSNHRITEAWFNGECGCSGAATGTHYFEYESNGSFSNTSDTYDTDWKTRTIVQRPDGLYLTQYFDEVGQALDRVITDADPDNTSPTPDRWVTHVTRDSSGFVTDLHTPANVTGYTHSSGAVTTSTSAGLVFSYTRATADAVKGYVTARKWKEGTSGTAYYDGEWEYARSSETVGSDSTLYRPFIEKRHVYDVESTSTTDRITTTITPTWTSSTVDLEKAATSNPSVATGENGSGSATTSTQYFDADGDKSFDEDEAGVITYWEYTDGRLTKLIEDADTSKTGSGEDFENVTIPSGLSSDSGAVHRVTTYAYDAQGRLDTTTQPDGRVLKNYYSKLADSRPATLRYNDYDSGTPKFYGPVSYTVSNHAGKAEVEATVALTSNESTSALTAHMDESDADPITGMDLGTVVRLTTNHYSKTGGSLEETRLYFDVPTAEPGTDGTHYDPTLFGYDDMGQRTRVKEAHGTITRTVYDIHGRVTERWLGTNDNSFDGGEASGTDDMVKTEALEYDSGADDGNGYLTKRTLYVTDSATDKRETTFTNDVKGNVLLEGRPTAPHAFHKYDNRSRRIATGLFSATTNIVAASDDPTTETSNRLALNQTYFDDMGRVWKTTRHKIDASDGSDDDNLETLNWYNKVGRLIKTDGPQLAKTTFDRLGRQTHRFILANDNDTEYAHADDVSGDIVLEEYQTVYESSDSDDVQMQVAIARHHDDRSTGETTGALDSNADSDDLLLTAADVEGRPQITAFWHDRFGRVTDTVRYGNYNDTNFDRDGLSVPSRSDTELLTENTWDTAGTVQDVTDPRGLVMRTERDDARRTTATIRNYVNGTPSSSTGDDDVYTRYEYTDGLRTKIWVDFDGDDVEDSGDQVTLYIYGTTDGTPSASEISTGHFLRATAYPDSTNTGTTEANINSDDSDVVSFAYNALGQEVLKKDQEGNVLETDYDDSGKRTALKVTTLDADFDGAVKRIDWSYTSLGQVDLVTSLDAVTSGSTVNEVDYGYDGWGNITSFKQDKDSAVGGSGYYEVAYTWEKETSGRNTVRKDSTTLPSGNVIDCIYSTADGRHDDEVSRVTALKDGAVNLSIYAYNGVGQVVLTDYPQPDVMWQIHGTTSGSYPDLDRFNRVTSSRWTVDLGTDQDFFDIDITYDRNSNITLIEDNVHAGFDVSYTIDALDRLERAQRGTWGGSSISSETLDHNWTLDQVGNWEQATLDFNADDLYGGTDEYNDDRTHNDVNELTARDTDDNGTDDYTLTYDGDGNLTDDGESYKYVYDPFGRLRKVNNQSDALVAEYKYNGPGHMIAVHEDTDTDGDVDSNDKWFYPVHDERWRMVANFREDDTAPKEEFVNHEAGLDGRGGSSYINAVVLRDKDANTSWTSASDGTLEERRYYCQNWRGDVSALVTSGGYLVEWDKYESYGVPFGLPGADTDSDGDCDSTDVTQIQSWIDVSSYDVRGDVDLDGDVDSSDMEFVQNNYEGTTLGRGNLSNAGSRKAGGGYENPSTASLSHVRYRALNDTLGRWVTRDPAGYNYLPSLYHYTNSAPVSYVDPFGLTPAGSGGGDDHACPFCLIRKPIEWILPPYNPPPDDGPGKGGVGGGGGGGDPLFNYGNYCGPTLMAPDIQNCKPIDAVDECCCIHDNAVGQDVIGGILAWIPAACEFIICLEDTLDDPGSSTGAACCMIVAFTAFCPLATDPGTVAICLLECAIWQAGGD